MSDSTLSEDQALALLHKLATDDGFRNRFEAKPAKALTEIGVTPEAIVELHAQCLERTRLARKEQFQAAVDALDKEVIAATMAMLPPQQRLGKT